MVFFNEDWLHTLDVWRAGQVLLPKVVRWRKYLDGNGGARRQDCLQHSFSLTLLARIFIEKLRPHIIFDSELLLTAALVHDLGEGETGEDTLYVDKNDAGDVREYTAFVSRFEQLPDSQFGAFHRAFLLQFALKRPAGFPLPAAYIIMDEIASTRAMEARAFEALERWDYVLYALEQYHHRGNAMILAHVLRNQVPRLHRLADELPGFGDEIFTEEMYNWCLQFMEAHNGQWIEQRQAK